MTIEVLLSLKALLVGGAFVFFLVYERLWPATDSPLLLRFGRATVGAWRRLVRNVSLFGINLLISPLIVVPITVWADHFSLGLRPAWWSGWPGLLLDLVLLDFWIYWWHRANHEIPFLWRFHQVHHFDELLDSTTAVRFHFGEVVISALVRALVIILFDLPLASVLLFEALVLVGAIFHHSDAAAAAAPGSGARQGGDHALDPLGAPPRDPRRYRQQLRHDLQLLGPAVPLEEPHAPLARDADRGRGPARPAAAPPDRHPVRRPAALSQRTTGSRQNATVERLKMHTGAAMNDSKLADKAATIARIGINHVADQHKLKHQLMRFFSIESGRCVTDAPPESTEV